MATYEITLEFETVLSVDGTRVKVKHHEKRKSLQVFLLMWQKLCLNTKQTASSTTDCQS